MCLPKVAASALRLFRFLLTSILIVGPSEAITSEDKAVDTVAETADSTSELGFELHDRLCKQGNWEACTRLGYAFSKGFGVDIDELRAVSLLAPACERDIAAACNRLASVYSYPKTRVVEKNYELAAQYLNKACDLGLMHSCSMLGNRYYLGRGVEKNFEQAAELYAKACSEGNNSSCAKLGSLYSDGLGVEKDTAQAESLLANACDEGEDYGCAYLGRLLAKPDPGSGADPYFGERILNEGCEAGGSFTCWHLSMIHKDGVPGIHADLELGQIARERACDKGSTGACIDLAESNIFSATPKQDRSPDVQTLERYCSRQVWHACYVLSELLFHGHAVPENKLLALDILRRACEGYHSSSCMALAELYTGGFGAEKPDPSRALQYKKRACTYGHPVFIANWCKAN